MKKKSYVSIASGILAGVALFIGQNQVNAATNTSPMGGTLVTKYNGKGKIRLLDENGKYQNQYVPNNAEYKVFEQGTINNQKMYRLGTQKQWIPAKFTNLDSNAINSNPSTTNAKNVLTIKYVPNYGIAVWNSPNANRQIVRGKYLKHNTSWRFFKEANGNDGYVWYNLGGNQWISSKYTNLPKQYVNATVIGGSNISKNANTSTSTKNPSKGTSTNAGTKTPTNSNTSKPTQQSGAWSQADVREAQNEFISYVNAWRKSEGLKPFENNVDWLQQGAEVRVNDNAQMFEQTGEISHYRANGKDWSDAFDVKGQLGGENIGYVGSSTGYTPKQAADSIAQGFINEGPNGGHYAVLHADYDNHPAIGVAFKQVERNGEYVYIMNMETGTAQRYIQDVSIDTGTGDYSWAGKWKGLVVPNITALVHHENGHLVVYKSELLEMGTDDSRTDVIKSTDLPVFYHEMIKYLQDKYGVTVRN